MLSPTFKGLGRRFALVGAAAALILAFSASSAFAEIVIKPSGSGPYELEGEETGTVEVEVTPPEFAPFPEATYVTVAQCNLTGVLGKRCFAQSGQFPQELTSETELPVVFPEVDIQREFSDFDFTIQQPVPGSETQCFSWTDFEGDPCGIVASYYKGTFPGLIPIGSESEVIWFE